MTTNRLNPRIKLKVNTVEQWNNDLKSDSEPTTPQQNSETKSSHIVKPESVSRGPISPLVEDGYESKLKRAISAEHDNSRSISPRYQLNNSYTELQRYLNNCDPMSPSATSLTKDDNNNKHWESELDNSAPSSPTLQREYAEPQQPSAKKQDKNPKNKNSSYLSQLFTRVLNLKKSNKAEQWEKELTSDNSAQSSPRANSVLKS